MSKRGLPVGVQMRHDYHYVEELSREAKPVGKIIEIDRIQPNPNQPRSEIGDLSELSASIKEKGVLEPLLVLPNSDGTYMIIAGERRWRAAKRAGLKEVPCIEVKTDERGVAEIALIENLQRKDLNVWEEADGFNALAHKFGYTQDDIAQKISKSRSTVTEFMTIAGLPEVIRSRCREANISSKSTLLEIARQFDDKAMHAFLDALISGEKIPRSKRPRDAESRPEAAHTRTSRKADAETNGFSFRYSGHKPEFDLILTFKQPGTPGRAEILKALKLTFDSVKSDNAEKP